MATSWHMTHNSPWTYTSPELACALGRGGEWTERQRDEEVAAAGEVDDAEELLGAEASGRSSTKSAESRRCAGGS